MKAVQSLCASLLMVTLGALCEPVLAQTHSEAEPLHGISRQLARSPADPTLEKAEINYRARRLAAALEQFGMIAAMEDHPFAWLRIGNILHRRGDVVGALDAYQRAQRAAAGAARFASLGSRAVMNQALLGLDQAQQALDALSGAAARQATDPWINEVRTRLDELSAALPGRSGDGDPPLAGAMPAHARVAETLQ